ncbi:hypothetical protein, partial [Desulfuromonas acetoxidans]|uniref:hypothetical protein n=1 Tax=Desulfuromonas acetoxidans TaxID=891 RepID=UPI001A7E83B9
LPSGDGFFILQNSIETRSAASADAGVAVTATTEWASLPFGTKNNKGNQLVCWFSFFACVVQRLSLRIVVM